MSNPGQGGNQPYQGDNPYAGPGAYRGPADPGRYGSSPAYGQQEPYAYNPYSQPPQPETGGAGSSEPVRRPAVLIAGLVLVVLSALPFLVSGFSVLMDPSSALEGVDQAQIDAALTEYQFTREQLLSGFQGLGGVVVALALIYVLAGVLAFTGRNWARIVLAVLTVGFALMLLAALVMGPGVAGLGTMFGLIIAASVGGGVLFFLPPSQAYFASRRR